jgi:hypothetical protein
MGSERGAVSSRQILITLSAVVAVMTVAGGLLFLRYSERSAANPDLVAVAPFDLPEGESGIAPWRVGLAVRLTESLPRNSRLTTLPQNEVARVWRHRATPIIAAVELARRTAAGLAVYGRVDHGAADSLVLRAAVIDAVRAQGLFEVAIALAPPPDLDRAADTLAAALRAGLERR